MLEIFRLLTPAIRKKARLLVVVSLCCAILEAAAVIVVVPMISMLMNPVEATLDPRLLNALSTVGVSERDDVSSSIVLLFIFSTTLGGCLRILLINLSARLSSEASAQLADQAFERIIHQKYEYLIGRNSNQLISILTEKIGMASGLILSVLSFCNAVVLLSFIWIGLLLVDVEVTFFTTVFLGSLYAIVIYVTRKRVDYNSRLISVESPRFLRNLRETFGSIRDIILSGSQPVYQKSFSTLSRKLKTANAENIVMSQSPRYVVEMISLTLVALLAQMLQGRGMAQALPILGALAIGAQRMLPLVQIIYSAYVNVRLSRHSLSDVMQVMDLSKQAHFDDSDSGINQFPGKIAFESVSFRYSNAESWVIKDLELKIVSGERFAVVGPSGVGKSTFLDLLTGLLEPVSGQITLDGVSRSAHSLRTWRAGVAYVPQSVFLIDGTICQNVAFGSPADQIDLGRVHEACRVAEIAQFIESRPGGYFATVGEQGVFMSGGQRQRLGIARAIYRDPNILILDEATNALDSGTEAIVLRNLHSFKPGLTIVQVTHRIDTARDFDFILEFSVDNTVRRGTFEELLEVSPSFRQLITHSRWASLDSNVYKK